MRSIRFRLALWYAVAVAAGLAIFATAVWTSTWRSLRNDLQHDLREQTKHIATFIHEQLKDARINLKEELIEYAQALPDGIIMEAHTPQGLRLYTSAPEFPWQSASARPVPREILKWHGDRYRLFAGQIAVEDLRFDVTFAASLHRVDDILRRLLWIMVGLTPAVVLFALAGGIWLSRRALKPVDDMTAAARGIGIEDLSRRLAVPQTGDELQRLAGTWNEMLARLEDAVLRLSRFTADASHELRTPLAVIRSTAEIAARRSRSEAAYRSALDAITAESERMTALIDDLLFLARCDADSLDLPMTSLLLNEVLDDVRLSLEPVARDREIELLFLHPEPDLIVWGHRAAIRRLVLILVDNAIKYSRTGSIVRITAEVRGSEVHLRVADQGVGIPPEELPFVFQRFYRGGAARESGNTGFGLGLALASGIAQQHRSSVRVSSTPLEGSLFEVALPVAAAR